jgi:hypothetical protein
MLSPPNSLFVFGEDEMLQDSTIFFLPFVFINGFSPSWIVSWGYHLGVIAFIDDEALKDV